MAGLEQARVGNSSMNKGTPSDRARISSRASGTPIAGQGIKQYYRLRAVKRREREPERVRAVRPRQDEVAAVGDQQHRLPLRQEVYEVAQQLKEGGVRPVQVFDDEQQRAFASLPEQPCLERLHQQAPPHGRRHVRLP